MALTPAQLTTLKAEILADPVLAAQPMDGNGHAVIADAMNALATPTFTVWKSKVTTQEVGEAFNSSEVGGLTTANTNRLVVMEAYSGGTFNPSRADTRAGFDSVFSGAGGVLTRAALLALYKRTARRIEKLFATGTGSDAVPATLVFEGAVNNSDIDAARNS